MKTRYILAILITLICAIPFSGCTATDSTNATNINVEMANVDDSENNLVYSNYDYEVDINSILKNESYYENHTQVIETPKHLTYIGKIVSRDIAAGGTCDYYYKEISLEFASGNCIELSGIPKNLQIGYVNVIIGDNDLITNHNQDYFGNADVRIPKLEA